jgi:spermidine/putrescine transport system permease protein
MKRLGGPWLFLAPSLGILLLVFAAPMLLLFIVSFWSVRSFKLQPDFSFAAWTKFITDYGTLTLYTLMIGLVVGLFCTLLGFVFAYAARFKAGRYGDTLMLATLVTLFGGYLVKIYAWKTILGATGIINQALVALGIVAEPVQTLIYSRTAVIIALTHFLLPFAILPIYAALRNVADATIDAARDLGASPIQVLLKVILPQIRGGLFAAFAFCFLLAAGDYVTPMLLGGSSGSMVGQFVLAEFSTKFNWPAGSAISFGLVAICLIFLAMAAAIERRVFKRGPA